MEEWEQRSLHDGCRLWVVLYEMLLGTHGRTVDRRSNEPTADGDLFDHHLCRENRSTWTNHLENNRSRVRADRFIFPSLASFLFYPKFRSSFNTEQFTALTQCRISGILRELISKHATATLLVRACSQATRPTEIVPFSSPGTLRKESTAT